MKNLQILFLATILLASIFIIIGYSEAATVGNPLDLDVPATSTMLRQQVIDNTLNEYEQIVKIKAALDLEFLFGKDLNSSSEVTNAELKGQWYMLKLGTTIFNKVEPYIKVGTSKLETTWRDGGYDIEVVSDYGFAWGGGVKGVIWDFDDWGIRLTGDVQYRTTGPDVKDITLDNQGIVDQGADFDIEEWQVSIVLSKKFELPLKWQSLYIVPYTGATISDSNVDVKFTNPSAPGQNWTLYEANNDNIYGFLIGCDIMPNLTSSFIYSMELRLANEMALTLGGAIKF
jgi:hypothetical protein